MRYAIKWNLLPYMSRVFVVHFLGFYANIYIFIFIEYPISHLPFALFQ